MSDAEFRAFVAQTRAEVRRRARSPQGARLGIDGPDERATGGAAPGLHRVARIDGGRKSRRVAGDGVRWAGS